MTVKGSKRVQKKPKKRRSPSLERIEKSPVFKEICERFFNDHSLNSIAVWLISDVPGFKGQKKNAVSEQLKRFFNQYKIDGASLQPISKAPVSTIPEIEKMERLADMQIGRIEMLHKKEPSVGFLFPALKAEITEARALLLTILEKKRELGLLAGIDPKSEQAQQTNIQTNIVVHLPKRIAKVVEDPKARRRVLDMIRDAGKEEVPEDVAFSRRFSMKTAKAAESEDIDEGSVAAS